MLIGRPPYEGIDPCVVPGAGAGEALEEVAILPFVGTGCCAMLVDGAPYEGTTGALTLPFAGVLALSYAVPAGTVGGGGVGEPAVPLLSVEVPSLFDVEESKASAGSVAGAAAFESGIGCSAWEGAPVPVTAVGTVALVEVDSSIGGLNSGGTSASVGSVFEAEGNSCD
jgi:hypothetical protein